MRRLIGKDICIGLVGLAILALISLNGCKDDEEEAQATTEETPPEPSKVEKPENKEPSAEKSAKKSPPITDRKLVRSNEKPDSGKRKPTSAAEKRKTTGGAATPATKAKDKKATSKEARSKKEKEKTEQTPKPDESAVERASKLAAMNSAKKEATGKNPTRARATPSPATPLPRTESLAKRSTKSITKQEPPAPQRRTAPKPTTSSRPALKVGHVLSAEELSQLIGKPFASAPLMGQPPGPHYNFLRFTTSKNGYGVGVQVWHENALRDTRARYEKMKDQYPNSQITGNVTSDTFFARWNDMYYLVFMELKKRRVISVTADAKLVEPNQLFVIATRVRDRVFTTSRKR